MTENVQKLHAGFMERMQKVLDAANPNVSITENGAVGLRTTGKALLDLNFKLSSMRNWDENKIWTEFLKAYNENPMLAIVWLFFARDARGGTGERRTFRIIFVRYCRENTELAIKLLPLISEYGRWDDLIEVFCGDVPCKVREAAKEIIANQIHEDAINVYQNKPVSLLSKWIPSANTSSKVTRRKAEQLRSALEMSPKEYRKVLSSLRSYIKVLEQKMSAREWSEIDYEAVPSKAGMNYREAFLRHDAERYAEYLTKVQDGKAKMNADVLFPYEIVHAYMADDWNEEVKDFDETLELKWKNLPNTVTQDNGTLVVVDGSGSMSSRIGSGSLTAHDVARSLGIYFAERLTGPFKNSFITFSANPKIVRFNGVESLNAKLKILIEEDECSNTNIEKTFDLILKTAVDNHLKQDEIPANVVIISDMEFDYCRKAYNWETGETYCADEKLFDAIAAKWNAAGYKLPRLVFWNVNSRTGTIPLSENELGVALVSGFSPMIADMVMSGELDPYKVLVDKLMSDRYEPVRRIVMPS